MASVNVARQSWIPWASPAARNLRPAGHAHLTHAFFGTLPRLGSVAETLPRSQIRMVMERAWAMERAGRKIFHLEVGQPDLAPPGVALEACKAALDDPVALRYCPNAGERETRQIIADVLQQKTGCPTALENIVVSVGVNGGITLVLSAIFDVDDEILVPDPFWPNVDMAAKLFKARPIRYRLPSSRGFLPNIEELQRLITSRTKALYVCSPSNPTGKVIPQAMMDSLIRMCMDHGIFLISDEIYGDIVFDKNHFTSCLSFPDMTEAAEHVIWLGGVSKAHAMTGFRVGFVRAPQRVVPILEKNQEGLLSCGVPFAQRGAAMALKVDQSFMENTIATYRRRRDLVVDALAEAGLQVPHRLKPDGAFYMLVPCAPAGPDCSEEVALTLLEEKGVACAPGGGFGREAENFLRLSFATSDEDVLEGARRLAHFLLGRDATQWWPSNSS